MKEKKNYGMILLLMLAVSGQVQADEIKNYSFVSVADTAEVLTMADVMPEIVGGLKEVYKNIKYPRAASMNNVEGRVFVRFIVDENGNVKKPEVLKDIGAGCGEAAIEGIKKVKFTPATNGGQPVSVYYTLPITFKIQE
ncbi:MAG: energy transducer TonB [Balneolaceae bacterium]|nr:energy transducer TonB [Balneolaceae bacterium]